VVEESPEFRKKFLKAPENGEKIRLRALFHDPFRRKGVYSRI